MYSENFKDSLGCVYEYLKEENPKFVEWLLKYYKENPALTIWESVEAILCECELL